MYKSIEQDFKNKSHYNQDSMMFLAGLILIILLTLVICGTVKNISDYYIFVITIVIALFFYMVVYTFIICKVRNEHRDIKLFKLIFKIPDTLTYYNELVHKQDKNSLKSILKDNDINTKPKVGIALQHYQSLMTKNVKGGGITLSVFAIIISVLSFILTEKDTIYVERFWLILAIGLILLIVWASVKAFNKTILRNLTPSAFYEKMEMLLSEIYFTYQKKEDEEKMIDIEKH